MAGVVDEVDEVDRWLLMQGIVMNSNHAAKW